MKKLIAIAVLLFAALSTTAQTITCPSEVGTGPACNILVADPPAKESIRILVGPQMEVDRGNKGGGGGIAVEVPIGSHLELDASGSYLYNAHSIYGRGYASYDKEGAIVWLSKSWGLNGGAEYSTYHTPTLTKGGFIPFGGPILRADVGIPMRLAFNYVGLGGGQLAMSMRVACKGPVCFRLTENIAIVHGTNQGGGSGYINMLFDGAFALEFPRKRGHEYDVF